MAELSEYLESKEVAELLHLNHQTIQRMAATGELPAVKLGRSWRFRRDVLDRILEERMLKTPALAGLKA